MDAIALYVLEKNDQAWCVHRTVHIVYASNLAQAFWTAIAAIVVCVAVTVAVSPPSLRFFDGCMPRFLDISRGHAAVRLAGGS
jgi:hypothetical protein